MVFVKFFLGVFFFFDFVSSLDGFAGVLGPLGDVGVEFSVGVDVN